LHSHLFKSNYSNIIVITTTFFEYGNKKKEGKHMQDYAKLYHQPHNDNDPKETVRKIKKIIRTNLPPVLKLIVIACIVMPKR
jgi:hypothetical protein